MSVYIKGMTMPKNCRQCFYKASGCICNKHNENRPSDCPLIPVPDHGRLIDADALAKLEVLPSDNWVFRAIEKAPTIIEADKEGDK